MPEFMEGTIDVPGAGKVKKRYILIPAGLAGVYVAWRWYQASQDTSGSDQGQSTGMYTSDDLSEYGLSTTGGGTTVTGNTGSTVTDATSSTVIDDNREWSNDAIERLTNQGYDGATVSAALGEFLDRRALDKNEATIVRAALAVSGQPPVGGPWSVLEESGAGTGTLPAPTNLRGWNSPQPTMIGLQWDKVDGALYYRVFRTDLGEEPIGASSDTMMNAKGLTPNSPYSFYVRAVGTTGKVGGKSNVVQIKTAAVKLAKPSGLKPSAITRTSFRVSCSPVPGATGYRWFLNGKQIAPSDAPYRDFTGLKAKTTYSVAVAADNSTQAPGPTSTAIKVTTKK
jgi:hypothetical protein